MPRARPLPAGLTDAQWWADAQRRYEEYWREFLGDPETLGAGAAWFYLSSEFGAAALMYQRAIDLLHTLYCCSDMSSRQPSPADLAIVDGYLNSLGASLSMHPDAPVQDSVAEVAHRLEDIRATCKAVGIQDSLYRQALLKLEPKARRLGVHINTAVLAEPRPTLINRGIMASGNAVVSGNAVASERDARAVVIGTQQSPATPEQISVMLRQFITELARTEESPHHPAKKQRLGSRPGNGDQVAAGLPGLAARGRPGPVRCSPPGFALRGKGRRWRPGTCSQRMSWRSCGGSPSLPAPS